MSERVLICGDRNWRDFEAVRRFVASLAPSAVVIEGEARGADTMARIAAEQHGLTVLRFPAQWDTHGRAAGPIRNQQMLTEGAPTLVAYFHDNIEESKGTRDMVTRARKAGIRVVDGRSND
jgi:hypothetical protein